MALANFLTIGAAKSGTSAMSRFLGEHPDARVPFKESNFFSGWNTRKRFDRSKLPDPRPMTRFQCGTLNEYQDLFANGWPPSFCPLYCGHYLEQLNRYLALFPRDQMRIFLYDDWSTEPELVWDKVVDSLEISDQPKPDCGLRYNENRSSSSILTTLGWIAPYFKNAVPSAAWVTTRESIWSNSDRHADAVTASAASSPALLPSASVQGGPAAEAYATPPPPAAQSGLIKPCQK
jgi:hypothetical protein